MTNAKQQKAAREFAAQWKGKGYEKGESQKFWLELLGNIFGVQDFSEFILFESQIKEKFAGKTITNFIDAYIPETKVMIEQKSSGKSLSEPIRQSDGSMLTPFQQARKYIASLPLSQHPRWVITCNFAEFNIYDMENPQNPPEAVYLKDLEKDFYRLEFLVNRKNESTRREEEISLSAGKLVGKMYDALIKEFIPQGENGELAAGQARSLNILCVRLVFCFYAEDAGLFATRTSFEDYLRSFNLPNVRLALINLFKALDTRIEERDKYDTSLAPFPYVNGGLFRDERIEIPSFTQEIVDVLCNDCAAFNWSEISPTIFGAVFESTLNPETRRKGGMHYTSIENIHKAIDPLFMDGLNREFEEINKISSKKKRETELWEFQKKLGSLTFLDPACGSGNFLTETFLSLRRLENKVISILNKGERVFGFDEFIHVKISQFFGIEINDFAVTVAKTALWIAESQMINETEKIMGQTIDFLPLTTNAFIVEGNALRMDWATLKPTDGNTMPSMPDGGLFAGITTHVDGSAHHYDYIMGNPPFVGARLMSESQKNDVAFVWKNAKNIGNADYVSCWYKKAADLIHGTGTKCALVSTNSITQGEQVAIMWKPLFEQGIKIDFAYRTFRWDSESTEKAHVHCVIVGFSQRDRESGTQGSHPELVSGSASLPLTPHTSELSTDKFIIDEKGEKHIAKNINGYLLDAPDIFVESRQKPLCDVPEIGIGNKPIDGGNYLFTEEEKIAFVKKEPNSKKYFHKWIGADEFINGYFRYCLWLGDCPLSEIKNMKECYKRVQAVRDYRLASKSAGTRKIADKPTRFHVENMPTQNYIVIPEISSEKRHYVPIGFMTPDIMCSNRVKISQNATIYHFGVLTSSVHMAWMRAVCGRLEMRYCYSVNIVYNNFPWCNPTDAQKKTIEKTAQIILDIRAKYPNDSLAVLYDDTLMPADLRKAHRENDRAVMQAYGFPQDATESEIVAELFKLYKKMCVSFS